MDCLQTCEILSAAHDGELVDAALLADARAHARTCAGCAAFVQVLDRIAATPAPGAPAELVSRIGELAGREADDVRRMAAHPALSSATEPATAHGRERLAWVTRFAALASAAAVLLVVLSAGGILLLSRTGQTAQEAVTTVVADDEALRAAPAEAEAGSEDATSVLAGSSAQPAFVTLDSAVWALTGVARPGLPPLTTAGSVTSSLGGSSARLRSAFYAGDDRSVLYVIGDDGSYLAFDRVARTLDDVRYGLVTGSPLDSFGMWPSLPGRFATPAEPNGSPVFESAGHDDRSVEVFVPIGGSLTDGFAVAPGTAANDPAAGNPGWTWWEPLP